MGHYYSLQNKRFVRGFHQKSPVKSAKRGFHTRLLPKITSSLQTSVSYETSSKLTLEVGKTSISYETSSFLQKSFKSTKREFHTRLPPQVARQVSKTSVSQDKIHSSSLQNERFVRDFLKNSHLKSAKPAFRTRLQTSSKSHASSLQIPPKVKREAPSEHTHQAALPSSFAIPAPPNNTRSHANPNVAATFTSTTTRSLTIPRACHEK